MSAPLELSFVTSAADVEQLPPSPAEVAVVGRSNVGKSSLLNALAGTKGLAKTSSKPGRTQLLNCFSLAGGGTMVDLPGYGFAHTSQTNRAAWRRRLDRYLTQRHPLVLTLLLVDAEVGPTKLDEEMLAWLRGHGVRFQIVATKHDKVKSSKRERRKRDLAAGCGVAPGDIVWVSAEKHVGVDRLRTLVRETLTAGAGRPSAPPAAGA
jgi:GTP-binding protein